MDKNGSLYDDWSTGRDKFLIMHIMIDLMMKPRWLAATARGLFSYITPAC